MPAQTDEEIDKRIAARDAQLEGQWVPPPPDPEDAPCGEAGYFLQIALPRFSDALDSVTTDSDRPIMVLDLSGKVLTFFEYRDCNMHCYARPLEITPERIRKGLIGALRYGKPFVLDMMGLAIDRETVEGLFEQVSSGLFERMLNKKIYEEKHCLELVLDEDGVQYTAPYWNPDTTKHFSFVLLSKHPMPPEWAAESFFVIRVAA